ncbi:MAG: helix-turn-helix domain-containing protein, partial [Deltaproteobacteria bacterium]|nr:helix-turn-helix domain-containing protein [Deltaproteobacteria bacterium]
MVEFDSDPKPEFHGLGKCLALALLSLPSVAMAQDTVETVPSEPYVPPTVPINPSIPSGAPGAASVRAINIALDKALDYAQSKIRANDVATVVEQFAKEGKEGEGVLYEVMFGWRPNSNRESDYYGLRPIGSGSSATEALAIAISQPGLYAPSILSRNSIQFDQVSSSYFFVANSGGTIVTESYSLGSLEGAAEAYLSYLARNPGRVVSIDEILGHGFPEIDEAMHRELAEIGTRVSGFPDEVAAIESAFDNLIERSVGHAGAAVGGNADNQGNGKSNNSGGGSVEHADTNPKGSQAGNRPGGGLPDWFPDWRFGPGSGSGADVKSDHGTIFEFRIEIDRSDLIMTRSPFMKWSLSEDIQNAPSDMQFVHYGDADLTFEAEMQAQIRIDEFKAEIARQKAEAMQKIQASHEIIKAQSLTLTDAINRAMFFVTDNPGLLKNGVATREPVLDWDCALMPSEPEEFMRVISGDLPSDLDAAYLQVQRDFNYLISQIEWAESFAELLLKAHNKGKVFIAESKLPRFELPKAVRKPEATTGSKRVSFVDCLYA